MSEKNLKGEKKGLAGSKDTTGIEWSSTLLPDGVTEADLQWVRDLGCVAYPDVTRPGRWLVAGYTQNFWWGCTEWAEGCANCLHPDTRVMMSDASWVRISDLRVGDELLGFDDEGESGHNRMLRKSIVQKAWKSRKSSMTIKTAGGRSLTCSPDHRFLVRTKKRGNQWIEAKNLKLGDPLAAVGDPDAAAQLNSSDYQAGYIAGATAGDGTMRFDPSWASDKKGFPQMYWRIAIAQEDSPILERISSYLHNFGITSSIKPFDGGKSGSGFCKTTTNRKPMIKLEHRAKDTLSKISELCEEKDSNEWKSGWLAGFLDTDGSASGSVRDTGVIHRWTQGKERNDYLQRTLQYLGDLGFSGELEQFQRKTDTVRLTPIDSYERVLAISRILPALKRKGIERLFGNSDGSHAYRLPVKADPVVGLFVEPEQELIDIQTSTGTFVAEGIGTHNCYAKTFSKRVGRDIWGRGKERWRTSPQNWNMPYKWNRMSKELFERFGVRLRVFCGSMMDWADSEVPQEWRDEMFQIVESCDYLDWLMLTKRLQVKPWEIYHDGMARMWNILPAHWLTFAWPEHVIFGHSVACQQDADTILVPLKDMAENMAANGQHLKIFISYGPATGPVDWTGFEFVDQIIIEGESGSGARQFRWEWALDTLDWCRENGVNFFFKQLGNNAIYTTEEEEIEVKIKVTGKGGNPGEWPEILPREYVR